MGYKAVLLYQDIPIEEWPRGVSGAFIYKILDLPVSGRVPDSRPWRIWTAEQVSQYSAELDDDFDRFDEAFNRMDADRRIDLALSRAENFGEKLFRKFKRRNVKAGLDKSQVRQLSRELREVEILLRGGSLKALLEEMANWANPIVANEIVLEYGNEVRRYLGLDPVEAIEELDDGVI